jgi:hypothetical protein
VVSEVSRSYNSLSGTDIRAVIGNLTFAEIQAISYSITREKAPIYTMGSPDPRAFSRNKRGIAGSLVWINFDRHALLALINTQGGTFVANVDDIRSQYTVTESNFIGQTVTFDSTITNANGTPASATIEQSADTPLSSASGFKALATPWASDQILPFDVTLAGTTEYGAAASMKIFGVEILNEGWGTSVDDAVNEMQTTFRTVYPGYTMAFDEGSYQVSLSTRANCHLPILLPPRASPPGCWPLKKHLPQASWGGQSSAPGEDEEPP